MTQSFNLSRFRDRRLVKEKCFPLTTFQNSKGKGDPFINYLRHTKREISVWSISQKEEKRLDEEYDREQSKLLRQKSILISICKLSKNKKERRNAAASLERLSSNMLQGISDSINFQKDASILLSDFEKKYFQFKRSCLREWNIEDLWPCVEAILFLCGRKLVIGEEKCDCNGECENCVSYRTGGVGFVKTKRINNAPYSKSSYMKGCISRYCGILPRSKIYDEYVFILIKNFLEDEYVIFFQDKYQSFQDFLKCEIGVFEIKIVIYIISTIAKKKKVFEIDLDQSSVGEDEWRSYRESGGTIIGKCKKGLYSTFGILKRSCKKTSATIEKIILVCKRLLYFSEKSFSTTPDFFKVLEKLDKVVSYVYYPRLTGKKLFNILPLQAGVYKNFPIQEKAIEKFMKGKRKNSPNVWIRLYFLLKKLHPGSLTDIPKRNFYPITNIHSHTCGCKLSNLQAPIEELIKEAWEDLGWGDGLDNEDSELCFV